MIPVKKVIIIFLVLTLFIPLAACNEQSDQNDKLDINISDDDISTVEPLEGTSTDAKLQFDETGGSSYITYNVSGDVEPYIENNMEFPDNMFIYKITNPTSENAAIYGYINENFERLSHPISLSPNVFSMGVAKIDSENESYFVNTNFNKIAELCANYVLIDNGIVKVSWGTEAPDQVTVITIKDSSSYLIPVKYDTGSFSEDGKIYKYGYMTVDEFRSGNYTDKSAFTIQPVFDYTRPFFRGLAAVRIDGKWGYIDEDGNFSIACLYLNAQDFIETSAFVFLGEYIKNDNPQPGQAAMKKVGNWGLIDMNGLPLIDFKLRYADTFHEGWAAVYYENESNYINTFGKSLLDENIQGLVFMEAFKDGLAAIHDNMSGKHSYYDTNGNNLFNLDISNTPKFCDGLAAIKSRGGYSYIDQTGNIVIEGKFLSANDFSNGYAFVIEDFGESGYIIDKMGNTYLKDLNINGMSKFNDEGYALAYTIVDKNETPQEWLYYMIHMETN